MEAVSPVDGRIRLPNPCTIGGPVGWAEHGALARSESDLQGGKTGGINKRTCPEAGPL
jgi:hypothetical protein